MRGGLRSLGVAVAALAALTAAAAPACASTAPAPGLRATTRSYAFTLTIGMAEQMWTPAQVRSMHQKTGEVILMGAMSGGMPMGGTSRNLEVHIYARATGEPVAGASPTISILDTSKAGAKPVEVPVAETEQIGAGAADVHYGNNVELTGGERYAVTVTLDGQVAVLRATAPG